MGTQVLLSDGTVAQGVVILTNGSTNAFANGQSGGGGGGGGDVQTLSTQLTASNEAQTVAAVLHGKTTAGGGEYVDVKVTPSGALVADVTSDQLPASLGQKTAAQSMPVVIASDQSAMRVTPGVPFASSGTILPLTTSATGATFMAFASQACVALDIVNNTGTTIEYRREGAGTAMQIPSGAARMVIGITNANQIDVRRTDTGNTQVTLQAEAFVV